MTPPGPAAEARKQWAEETEEMTAHVKLFLNEIQFLS